MINPMKNVCMLGGTGFVGRKLARQLCQHGYNVTIASRRPERHRDLRVNVCVRLVRANVQDEATLQELFRGQDVVINLIGILNETRHQSFRAIHVDLPRKVMKACWKSGVGRMLHMSALKADAGTGTSQYLRTKGEAEDLLHVDAGDDMRVTRFRPSVIFGPEDQFFNRFAALLKQIPLFFPLACPQARFAPVYVGDVAQAFIRALEDPLAKEERYDLCGPREYTLHELVQYTADQLQLRRRIIPLGNVLSQLQAAMMELVPGKPFTLDNYHSLQIDSVCRNNGLLKLGIQPTPLESVVPAYLGQLRHRQNYDRFRRDTCNG